jgi:hypothetical protein
MAPPSLILQDIGHLLFVTVKLLLYVHIFLYFENGGEMRSNKKILVIDNAGCVPVFLANGEC